MTMYQMILDVLFFPILKILKWAAANLQPWTKE